jgi:hypothetical protein
MNKIQFFFLPSLAIFGDLAQIRGRDRGDPRELLYRALCFCVWAKDDKVKKEVKTVRLAQKSAPETLNWPRNEQNSIFFSSLAILESLRFVVGIEAILGSFSIALFVFVFGRKMAR